MTLIGGDASEITYDLKLIGNELCEGSFSSEEPHHNAQHLQCATIHLQICEQRGLSHRLWPGAVCLLEYLLSCPSVLVPSSHSPHAHTRTRVLELGCGTGFVSVCLARALPGLQCLATDLPSVVPLVRANIIRNIQSHFSHCASAHDNPCFTCGVPTSSTYCATHRNDSSNDVSSSTCAFVNSAFGSTSRTECPESVSIARPQQHEAAARVDAECSECEARALAWGDSREMSALLREGPVSLVLGSDLVYWPQLEPLLRAAIADIVEQHALLYPDVPPPTFLFAQTHRFKNDLRFFRAMHGRRVGRARLELLHMATRRFTPEQCARYRFADRQSTSGASAEPESGAARDSLASADAGAPDLDAHAPAQESASRAGVEAGAGAGAGGAEQSVSGPCPDTRAVYTYLNDELPRTDAFTRSARDSKPLFVHLFRLTA